MSKRQAAPAHAQRAAYTEVAAQPGDYWLADGCAISGSRMTVCGDGNEVHGNEVRVTGRGNTVWGRDCTVTGPESTYNGSAVGAAPARPTIVFGDPDAMQAYGAAVGRAPSRASVIRVGKRDHGRAHSVSGPSGRVGPCHPAPRLLVQAEKK